MRGRDKVHQFLNKNNWSLWSFCDAEYFLCYILNQEEGARLQFSREGAAGDE